MPKAHTYEDKFSAAASLITMLADALNATLPSAADKLTPANLPKFSAVLGKAVNDLVDSDAESLPGSKVDTFDKLVDDEIARFGDDAKPRPVSPSMALARSFDIEAVAPSGEQLLGVEKLVDIARELGIDAVGMNVAEAIRSIHDGLVRLKNPGDLAGEDGTALSKGDSLAEAMRFGRAAEASAREEVARLRLIVQRVAGAMQVPMWDADGTELIEKAQRWDQARYTLKKRINELEARMDSAEDHGGATELRFALAALTSQKEAAKWLSNKPKATVTTAVLDVCEKPTDLGAFDALTPSDTIIISESMDEGRTLYLQEAVAKRHANLCAAFSRLSRSVTASTEFCDLMNLIILPILARQNPPRTR